MRALEIKLSASYVYAIIHQSQSTLDQNLCIHKHSFQYCYQTPFMYHNQLILVLPESMAKVAFQ